MGKITITISSENMTDEELANCLHEVLAAVPAEVERKSPDTNGNCVCPEDKKVWVSHFYWASCGNCGGILY